MNREVLRLQRDLIDGPEKGHPPFDRYAYNSFAWSLQDLSYHASSPEERALCLWLKQLAIEKSTALRTDDEHNQTYARTYSAAGVPLGTVPFEKEEE